MKTRYLAFLATVPLITAGTLTACGASDPYASAPTAEDSGKPTIVVGSANFSENILLGEIYAKTLENQGFAVERKLNIGAREVLYSQVENCTLDVVPEYNQALLAFIAPDVSASGTEEVNSALQQQLPDSLQILKSSEAQNNNSVAVTSAIAQEFGLTKIEDLAAHAEEMTFGGPTEWKTRSDGYQGLAEDYGVSFREYKNLDYSGPITLAALGKGDIDAALLFSTTPQIETEGFVVLQDPKNTIGVNNVTPLICANEVPEAAQDALGKISESLSTEELTLLNKQYVLDHRDAAEVANEWITQKGLS
ncbi:ABC transporter substrate-binding protein [Glutamicibacter sp. NPDC087344]|uniref:ABC transporter substrate-binding protein n=1 Tax=Glutamicibacter sp. NPDC087344 TaxID=3363994 RepID=UPI0037F28271